MFEPSNNSYEAGELLTQSKSWWSKCPLFTKILLYFGVLLAIISIFTHGITDSLMNIPLETIGHF